MYHASGLLKNSYKTKNISSRYFKSTPRSMLNIYVGQKQVLWILPEASFAIRLNIFVRLSKETSRRALRKICIWRKRIPIPSAGFSIRSLAQIMKLHAGLIKHKKFIK